MTNLSILQQIIIHCSKAAWCSNSCDSNFLSYRQGSGFFITDDGVILTCAHIISPNITSTYRIIQNHEVIGEAFLADVDYLTDLAVLFLEKLCQKFRFPNGCPFLSFKNSSNLDVMDELELHGFPGDDKSGISTFGILSSKYYSVPISPEGKENAEYVIFWRTDAAGNPGKSGCPVLNDGKVVGIFLHQARLLIDPGIHEQFIHPTDCPREQNGTLFTPSRDIIDYLKINDRFQLDDTMAGKILEITRSFGALKV